MFEPGANLDAGAFQALDRALIQVLDVRERWEYDLAFIPGAILLPLGELMDRAGELDPRRPVIVYCHHGMRSLQAQRYLQGEGFTQVANLRGGIDAYSRLDPSVPRY
jgi:adenylyltransferase/sulfurtransferase